MDMTLGRLFYILFPTGFITGDPVAGSLMTLSCQTVLYGKHRKASFFDAVCDPQVPVRAKDVDRIGGERHSLQPQGH